MKLQFLSLVLEDCPPVGSLSIEFSPKINLIVGPNGSGKSTLVECLRTGQWRYGGNASLSFSGDRSILEEFWPLLNIGRLWDEEKGDRPECHWTKVLFRDDFTRRRACHYLSSVLLKPKLGQLFTKFSAIPYCGEETFDMEINEKGDVTIHAGPALKKVEHFSPYGCVEQLFLAAGEQFMILFAGVLAAREHFGLDAPLIFGDDVGNLDEYHLTAVVNLISSTETQTVIPCNPAYESLLGRLKKIGKTHDLPVMHRILH